MTDRPDRLAVLGALPAVVLELTPAGQVTDSNGRLEALLGEAVVDRQLAELMDPASRIKLRRMLGRHGGRRDRDRWEFCFSAGPAPAVRAFTPVWSEDGERLWLLDADLGSGDDTLYDALSDANSELVNAQRELTKEKARVDRALRREEEARAAADAAVRLRDEVLAIVSHDLRGPVGTIQTSAGALLDFGDQLTDEGRVRQLEVIRRSSERAIQLIADLLDIARLEAGHLTIKPQHVELEPLLDELCQLHSGRARARKVRVQCSVDRGAEHLVADPNRIQQAVSNLLDNAVRYSPEGGVVEIVAAPAEDTVRIEVRDQGPGIPPAELDRLFDRFWQASKANRGSAGLGLSIVRGLAEAHGGAVTVESELGKGSTFALVLPRQGPSG